MRWRAASAVDSLRVRELTEGALRDVDERMSTWRDDSELMRARVGSGPIPVSEPLAQVVGAALGGAARSGGAFDPTVLPLMSLWGLHGTPRTTLPSDSDIAEAQARVGWERVALTRDDQGRALLDAGGTALDLSAIAKGYAVDRVFEALVAEGVTDLLVEVGGDLRVAGRSPRGGLWSVGVDRPVVGKAPGADLVATVQLTNLAVVTSGNYRNRTRIEGVEIHHTMDPRTGRPASNAARSASVVAPDAMTADIWSTALMVLGVDGLEVIEALPGVDAWILVEGEGGLEAASSTGMKRHLRGVNLGERGEAR